ncbi:MAG: antibiotic biosynthesis monooxygenase [Pseudomonadota bacterium]
MFIVTVDFVLREGMAAEFMPYMLHNAETSLTQERDCFVFDVCQDPDRPEHVFLYEAYTDKKAFQLHLEADHFAKFDAATAGMIEDKRVRTFLRL